MNIKEYMNAYLKERDMTLVELTAKLGYKSKTSIVRIMNGDVTVRSFDKFVARMRKLGDLTEKESAQLDEAVELMRWQEDYHPSREMLGFLQGWVREEGSVRLEYINPFSGDDCTGCVPLTFDDTFNGATEIDILLVNSQYVPIFEKLRNLIAEKDAKISHYLMINEDTSRTIHAMNVIFPIMFMSGYSGYLFAKNCEQGHNGVQSSDFMLVNWRDASGVRCESLILFDTPNHGRVYRSVHPGTLAKLLEIPKECYKPIKKSFVDDTGADSYVDFSLECASIERNRRIFAIKPDICLESIPVEILLKAAREGLLGTTEEFVRSEEALCEIFIRRYKNTFESRQVRHMIMKRSALWKFVRTGRLSDHFWGMRAFTLQERAEIMRSLLKQAENNPYFHMHFLKDNQFLRDMEIFCYDGKGILIVNVNADYDLNHGHAEVMLDHPEFQRLYKEFYLKHLIREHVIPQADTIEFLRSLVEYCEDPNTEENIEA